MFVGVSVGSDVNVGDSDNVGCGVRIVDGIDVGKRDGFMVGKYVGNGENVGEIVGAGVSKASRTATSSMAISLL